MDADGFCHYGLKDDGAMMSAINLLQLPANAADASKDSVKAAMAAMQLRGAATRHEQAIAMLQHPARDKPRGGIKGAQAVKRHAQNLFQPRRMN